MIIKRFIKWWWKQNAKTRRWILIAVQTSYACTFILLFGFAVTEAVKDNPDYITLHLLVLAFAVQLAVAGFVLSRKSHLSWFWKEFTELRHEFAGAVILTGLALFLVTIPSEHKAKNQLKQQLIREMGSSDSGIALRAVRELTVNGWLYGDSVRGAFLANANLQNANLGQANLQEVLLWSANLQGAYLWNVNLMDADLQGINLQNAHLKDANLQGAALWGANLRDADLRGANLQDADLRGANLQDANLQGIKLKDANLQEVDLEGTYLMFANLEGVNLHGASLQDASLIDSDLRETDLTNVYLQHALLQGVNLQESNLEDANLEGATMTSTNLQGVFLTEANLRGVYLYAIVFDENTILPDGTPWTPDTDMTRFTDPDHLDFWRSNDPTSPAYSGR